MNLQCEAITSTCSVVFHMYCTCTVEEVLGDRAVGSGPQYVGVAK